MYLYLREEDGIATLPTSLLDQFGVPRFVMQLELHPDRQLARADIAQVMRNLLTQGYHLQMPPTLTPQMYYGNDL